MNQKTLIIGFSILYVVTGVAIGIGLYYAGYYADHSEPSESKRDVFMDLQNEISAAKIDQYLKHLSSVPHLAGTKQDLEQAEWVRDQYLSFGLDKAKVVGYQVFLSYPDMEKPNKVYLLDNNGNANFTTSGKQPGLFAPEESSTLIAPNFNAYSGTGIYESDGLVYVYFGREVDYKYLAEQEIDVNNKIVLARYGGGFRGNMVALAEEKGAKGMLLFSDPNEFAKKGAGETYPNSWWMPGMAAHSGTVYVDNGDPLTPFYPAIESAYRIPVKSANLPSILVQPIGYDEAEILLRNLKGKEAPVAWRGKLNVTYSLGPEFRFSNWTIKMEILTANKMATIYNTIGMLYGEEEPDRYVLMGNHRDAWSLGAIDPSSGTSCMLEMARAFGKVKLEQSWRPRRSLVFCSWGAEEYGLIGSYEWVEEHAKVLSQRAVAYLNVDMAVQGNYSLWGKAAPLMRNLYLESSKKIPNPSQSEVANGRLTVYDTWLYRYPDAKYGTPIVNILGSGSDYTSFMHIIGIPSLDIRYNYGEAIETNPLYHTAYETHHLAADIIDPGFLHHRAITQLLTEIARSLSESVILPFNATWYASYLTESFANIKSRYEARLLANNATLSYFEAAVNYFEIATRNFEVNTLTTLDLTNALNVRRANDQLTQLERHFVDPHGLPNRAEYNHIVFAPSGSNSYVSSSFSGLTDLLEAVGNKTETERPTEWAQIKQHLGVIAFYIEAAGRSLSVNL